MTDIDKKLDGWYDLRSSLPQWLGERLVHMSKACITYPNPNNTFPSEMGREQWQALLMQHGQALLDHAALDVAGDATETSINGAKAALHWAADWLEDLWD